MADYDPKRRRPRPPTPSDEPAAVDALLDAAAHAAAPQPDPDVTGETAATETSSMEASMVDLATAPAGQAAPSKVAPSWDQSSWADGDRPLSPMVSGGMADEPRVHPDDDWAMPIGNGASRQKGLLVAAVVGALLVVVLLVRRRRH
jgi:hypothetical protein